MTFAACFLQAYAQDAEEATPMAYLDSLPGKGKQVQVAYRKLNADELLGGVSFVNVKQLLKKNYFTYSLGDMQNYVGGLTGGNLWGMNSVLVLVDGVPRDAGNVMPSEIEQITFLKGAQAVVLYGSRAADGVIYITTKRGQAGKTRIDVRGNTGFYVPIRYPEYLGGAEYMTLYNEARVNDGLEATYTPEQIYHTAQGDNPFRYPDVNLYSDDYLKKAYNSSDATAEIYGGSQRARFYTNINLYNTGSLIKFGEADKDRTTRFSVRGNVDVNLGKYVDAYADANATFYDAKGARGNFWGAASTLRPNRIAPLIPIDMLMPEDETAWNYVNSAMYIIDGKYLLGGTSLDQTNELANLLVAGTNTYTSRQYQFNMGVNVDLSMLLRGLSFKTQYALDYSTSYNNYYSNGYATYEPQWGNFNGHDVITSIKQYGTDSHDGIQHVSDSWNRQTMSFSAQFDYKNQFAGVHNVSANLIAAGWQRGTSAVYHKDSNVNLGLQLDYNYLNRYYVSFGGALIHSARLPEKNRQAFSPSLTLGWRLAKESFLEDSPVVDDLMLTASASVLNTDLDFSDYYMYEANFNQSNGAWWGWADGNQSRATESRRGANDQLDFVQRKEISIGIRGSLWKKMLTFDASFFTNSIEGLPVQSRNSFPNYFFSYWPESSLIPYVNYNNSSFTGFDFALNYNKKVGEVDLGVGLTGTYYTSKNTKVDEMYNEDYRYRKGKPTDGIWGYVTDGFYKDLADIENSPESTFGDVKPGDLKYVDQNGDNVIDEKDEIYLGEQWGSPFTLGMNITAKWKNFTLYVAGSGYFGAAAMKSDAYYWVYGDRKYSEVVRGRWTPETASTATYPRLTTQSNTHNFRNSDFWMYKNDRFNLSKIQLTYDLPASIFQGSFVKNLSVYAYASNVFTIAKERKLLETSASPQTHFYNLGFKIGF